MSNYTTQTASLKATTIDTRKIDTKQIDTKKLFINGELFDPYQIKDNPNEAKFMLVVGFLTSIENRFFMLQSMKSDQDGEYLFTSEGHLLKGSETNDVLPNGVYAVIQIDDNFLKCIGWNSSLNDADYELMAQNILLAKFVIQATKNTNSVMVEQCILKNFITRIDGQVTWVIKIYEEDDNDNLSELYGGLLEDINGFIFLVSIPYYIPENDTSSSTYSLRRTNPFDSLREKFEQMRQQILDNSTE